MSKSNSIPAVPDLPAYHFINLLKAHRALRLNTEHSNGMSLDPMQELVQTSLAALAAEGSSRLYDMRHYASSYLLRTFPKTASALITFIHDIAGLLSGDELNPAFVAEQEEKGTLLQRQYGAMSFFKPDISKEVGENTLSIDLCLRELTGSNYSLLMMPLKEIIQTRSYDFSILGKLDARYKHVSDVALLSCWDLVRHGHSDKDINSMNQDLELLELRLGLYDEAKECANRKQKPAESRDMKIKPS